MEDLKAWLGTDFVGSAETAAAPFWRLAKALRPDLKTVLVRRPVEEVYESLQKTGVPFDSYKLSETLFRLNAKLDQISARTENISVTFDELRQPETCKLIWYYCLGMPWDQARWQVMNGLNLQINLGAQVRHFQAHQTGIEGFARQAGAAMRAKLMAKPVIGREFTFQQEPIDKVLTDGMWLLEEHAIQIGEPLDTWKTKNFPLMKTLEGLGVLHVTTARSNGKMFGYLVSITAPSLESLTAVEASHTSFYTSASTPGLGLRLQRASVDFLREKGVDSVQFRAGHRGAGPRTGVLYKRLGAEPFGELYRLNLKEFV